MASAGMIMKKRPTNIAMPSVSDQKGLEAVSPAKAEPLFPVAEVEGVEHLAHSRAGRG